MHIRNVRSQDYEKISPLINQWWGGRNMEEKLPKLFFVHFQPTSLMNQIVQLLLGVGIVFFVLVTFLVFISFTNKK
ncbi:hypothetical protein [Sediminibacillus terrae]|uniref:hypothetical protein n=1 Tax=Sediminibacillus terrae TaxID=1562106 RepID=UPI0012972386